MLEWDAVGEKFFETGVSKVALFLDPTAGVAWNGVQNISVDPQGGDPRSYYFDGVKYLETTDAEDFQATITALQAPAEFRKAEGERVLGGVPGMYVPGTGYREKFHLAWRTQIGNDVELSDKGYWLHISYNGVVQPNSKSYSTLGDATNPDARTWTYKTTPACGRFSYYKFNSLECDLSRLEAEINNGNLPPCNLLFTFIDPLPGGGGGGGDGADPDFGCLSLLQDFESFQAGATFSPDPNIVVDDGTYYNVFGGVINSGVNFTEIHASGAFAANDSAATETGTHPVLLDDDDATYIGSASGDLGYTIALDPLIGYKPGVKLELHIRMSVSGDVDTTTDDSEVDADAQVFITTDADGDIPVGGFSDGTDDGMSFAIEIVDGTPQDYVVPLDMDPWLYTTQDDVGAALAAGAYLNVVAVNNNNPDTTPAVRVYEASVFMVDDTDQNKFLRPDDAGFAYVESEIFEGAGPAPKPNTYTVDFKASKVAFNADFDGYTDGIVDYTLIPTHPTFGVVSVDTGNLKFAIQDEFGVEQDSCAMETDKWHRVQVDWGWTTTRMRLFDRDDLTTALVDVTLTSGYDPKAACRSYGGFIGDADTTFEVVVDNTKLQIHCNEENPLTTPGTHTVYVPARQILSRPFGGGPDTAWATDDGNTTRTDSYAHPLAETTDPFVVKYGSGPNAFNWSLPDGATVDSVKYVISAMAEMTGKDAAVEDNAGPILILKGGVGGDRELDMGAYVIAFEWMTDQEWAFTESWTNLAADNPYDTLDMLNRSVAFAGDVITYISYLAIKITYTIT